MAQWYERTQMMFGADGVRRLSSSRVAVFGAGGVGGYALEALARSGVGAIDVVDPDIVTITNLNRQILATRSTLGMCKADAAAARIKDINPTCEVKTYKVFVLPETIGVFDFSRYDYVIDAIDTVSGKIAIAEAAFRAGVPAISAMGAGNKLSATAFEVADLFETSVCPLARVMRHELKKRGIARLKVVYSREQPVDPLPAEDERAPSSNAFVPGVAGLILAGEAVKDLTGIR